MNPGPLARFREIVAQASTMEEIVQRIAEDGETLKSIAKAWDVPYAKLAQWVVEDKERSELYSRALRFAAETFAHEIVPIVDGKHPDALQDPAARKLQMEGRKWLASKWDRARYGDTQTLEHKGSLSLVAVLAGLPRTGKTIDLDGKDVEVIGPVTPAEKIPEQPEKVEAPI